MPPPSVPAIPTLASGATSGRGVDYLQVNWSGALGATAYRLLVFWHSGNRVIQGVTPGSTRIDGLVSNRNYRVRVQAINNDGATESAILETCTRLPTPGAPSRGFNDMTHLEINLVWDVSGIVNGLDDQDRIKVILGEQIGGSIQVIGEKDIRDEHRLISLTRENKYYLRLICSNKPVPPDNSNRSDWSAELVAVKDVFAKMQIPGSQDVHRRAALNLRRFYGKR